MEAPDVTVAVVVENSEDALLPRVSPIDAWLDDGGATDGGGSRGAALRSATVKELHGRYRT